MRRGKERSVNDSVEGLALRNPHSKALRGFLLRDKFNDELLSWAQEKARAMAFQNRCTRRIEFMRNYHRIEKREKEFIRAQYACPIHLRGKGRCDDRFGDDCKPRFDFAKGSGLGNQSTASINIVKAL